MTTIPTRPITSSERQSALFWLFSFLLVQMACQIALLIPSLAAGRIIFRTAAFGISLVALVMVPGRSIASPSRPLLFAAIILLALSIFHPSTNTPLVAVAHTTLYLAIMAPIVWVSRLRIEQRTFFALISFLWFFHTISASVGLLQTLFPGQFEMAMSTALVDDPMLDGLKITLADGSVMFRPSGLTDSPGGASSAGLLAYIFGLGFLSTSRRFSVSLLGTAAVGIGLYCIYLSQIRVNLVLSVICTLTYLGSLLVLGRIGFAVRIMTIMPGVIIISTLAAFAVGGKGTIDRLSTLIEANPQEIYSKNRGQFLEETFTEHLPNYPMGAGLGRWGMVRSYFGDNSNPNSPSIWVEIQLTAWVLDGGLPLLLLYTAAILLAIGFTLQNALRCADPWLSTWGLLVVGYDVAIFATLFSYVPFIGQMGLEFWLFNTAYWGTVRFSQNQAGRLT